MDPTKAGPWQVDWKRPRWNQIIDSTIDDTSINHDDQAIVVGSASAEIDPQELPTTSSSLASQIIMEASSSSSSSLLLSVTLLSRQSASQIQSRDNPVASELLLELYECPATVQDIDENNDDDDDGHHDDNNPDNRHKQDGSRLLASKRLQWPEAIFDAALEDQESNNNNNNNENNKGEQGGNVKKANKTNNATGGATSPPPKKENVLSKINDWLTLSPLLGKLDDKKSKTEQSFLGNNPNGLLSAVLLRRPKEYANPTKEDVMDTIALMSLGMGNMNNNHNNSMSVLPSAAAAAESTSDDPNNNNDHISISSSRQQNKEQEEGSGENNKKTKETSLMPDLYLACMTVRGLVTIYSPWTLLLEEAPSSSDETKSPDMELVDSLATLFMGQEIFSALEQAWKPLSEPLSTISLSILEQNQLVKKRRKRALDVSMWNHLVESATIPHRTVANRATKLAVAGPCYLAVFGSGIPYTQVFRHDDESSLGGDRSNTHHQSVVDVEEYEQDEWWENHHESEQVGHHEQRPSDEVAFLRPRFDSNGSDWFLKEEDDGSVPKVQLISGPIQEWVRRDSDDLLEDDNDGMNDGSDEGNKLKKWWERIRKTSSNDDDGTEDLPLNLSTGGFITFCSISQWSETRTLFLPFVPKQISYIAEWNSMEIVLVMGETQAIAVRLDSSQAPVVIGNVTDQLQQSLVDTESGDGSVGAQSPVKKENYMNIKRFQVLPIALPQSTVITSRILCGSAPGVQPPALLQLFTEETHHGLVLQKSLKGITALGTIELSHAPSDVAKIHVGETESLSSSWSVLGQGWSLLGTSENVYFICWEGATVAGGVALVQALNSSPTLTASLPTCVDFVSPRRRYIADGVNDTDSDGGESSEMKDSTDEDKEEDGIDRIVVQAMESVAGLSTRLPIEEEDDDEIGPESHISSEERPLSNREKSVRLLSRCSSWTRLEHTLDKMDRQVHIVSLRSGNVQAPKYTFTLRQLVIENGATSPFDQVLSWLSDRGDYFTASSIALNLLQDAETLYHLWRTADKIDNIEEQNKLEGLLDGIEPIEEFDDENDGPSQAMVQLADMTVGCLAKGGLVMSSTLEKFLRENKLYDPSRACLMLVSTTANTLSEYYDETTPTPSVEELLWPVRSLLEAGVARDCLPTALLLLNSTIPDELRAREQKSGLSMIDVTKALISAIVASDKSAPELLLNLTEGTSKQKYWQSLDHDTQLVLSLTFVTGKYPLLHHQEIRSWARERLHSCIANESSSQTRDLPSEFLRKLVSACLANAGCNQEELEIGKPQDSEENSPGFEDSVNQHRLETIKFRNAIEPIHGVMGVDFDLLVPCLLILHQRGIMWNGDGFAPTQSLLDAACYVAGRHSPDRFAFAFDSSTVMKQCAMTGNVRAAANLIGGANGFVLHCSDILIQHLGVTMKDAEAFFLNDALSIEFLESFGGKDNFQLGEAHRDLLLLLDENILTIQTYGEFDTAHIRGRVDPVFSSRSILRAWLCLSYGDKGASVDWLVKYLRKRLKMEEDEGRSPYRLPCAALCRSLFWAEGGSTSDSLSVQMGMDMTFLVQLALSCCGLVESIPLAIAKEVSAKVETPKLYSMPQVQFPSADRLN